MGELLLCSGCDSRHDRHACPLRDEAMGRDCPDCGALPGEACDWACSTRWI